MKRSGWDGAPLNRSFYPVAALSVAALLALLVLETRADVVYPAVYCWAVGAIVVRPKTAAACWVLLHCCGAFGPVSSDSLSNNPGTLEVLGLATSRLWLHVGFCCWSCSGPFPPMTSAITR